MTVLLSGIREPFRSVHYTVLFAVLVLAMLVLFTLIPVWTVAGNTLATQLKIFTPRDYAILILLSGLSALFITMQIYVIRLRKKVRGVGRIIGGGLGALFAGIAGTAFCVSCLVPLFAVFGIGLGGVVFILNYRLYFVAVTTLLLLIGMYLTARQINKACASC